MRFLLNSRYRLCGWDKLPCALLDRKSGSITFLSRASFELLSHCDCKYDFQLSALTEQARTMLSSFQKQGLITPGDEASVPTEASDYRLFPTRFRASAQWSVTGTCNCSCRHCLIRAPENALGQLSTSDCLEIIRQLGECGIHQISLTGGEPLIRPDFFRLVDALTDQEIIITAIYSNGLLISDTLLQQLTARGIRPLIQMSYDGCGKHDWLRGLPGAEGAVIQAFQRCRDYGFPTSAAMCLHRENIDTLAESIELLASLGCTGLKVSGLRLQGDARQLQDIILTREELFTVLLQYIPHFFEAGAPIDLMLDGLFAYLCQEKRFFIPFERKSSDKASECLLCDHVRRSLYISPSGQVLPCMSMADTDIAAEFPNMLETPLKEILQNSDYMHRCNLRLSDYLEHNPECAACSERFSCCGGCRALALGDTGHDYLARDPWACAYFRDGWREKLKLCLEEAGLSADAWA